jgi:hypothetical protein
MDSRRSGGATRTDQKYSSVYRKPSITRYQLSSHHEAHQGQASALVGLVAATFLKLSPVSACGYRGQLTAPKASVAFSIHRHSTAFVHPAHGFSAGCYYCPAYDKDSEHCFSITPFSLPPASLCAYAIHDVRISAASSRITFQKQGRGKCV